MKCIQTPENNLYVLQIKQLHRERITLRFMIVTLTCGLVSALGIILCLIFGKMQ